MPNLYFPKDTNDAKRLSALVQRGKLNRIRQGIYTDASMEEIPSLLESRWYEVVAYLCHSPLAAYRTAYELRPVHGHIFIVSDVKKRTKIAVTSALTINVFPGDSYLLSEQFVPALSRSALPRLLLENLTETRSTAQEAKSLGPEWVEERLCKELERRGEDALNILRDQARSAAPLLGLEKEFSILDKKIGAVLSTQTIEGNLSSPQAIATAKNEPFDSSRQILFEALASYLKQCDFKPLIFDYTSASWRNLSFFESYFSNYIEGTEFEIDEAEEIVFSRQVIGTRHEDSHDVLDVFDIVSDYQEMTETPNHPDEFLELIQSRHHTMMTQREDKRPGQFKRKTNKAGESVFVSPENLAGTLTQGFSIYKQLPEGLARSIFMQFLIAECHPFDDGNGRLSRIMMNAELHSVEQHKLIVPTVHRDSYLNGLRQATRQGKFKTLVKVFFQLQCYSASINWLDYGEARELLELHKAHALPDDGIAVFNKQIKNYKMNFPSM
ncbi:MAG: Fic family protein [Oleiphilus sp.]